MPVIELKSITAGYNAKTVLKDISLSFPKGKLISVIGKNGCGKSTLLKTVIGIVTASGGDIIIDGIAASELSRQDKAKKISYLAQGKGVSDMTVKQLVLHGRFPHLRYPRRYSKIDRDISNNALQQMGLSDFADTPLSELSGGMRQKAYLAMALAQDTDYILLDEPTTYLDISNQVELMKTLRSLADNGVGIVAVMHDLPLAFGFSDGVAVIKDGTVAAYDAPRRLCDCGIVRDVFGVDLLYSPEEGSYHYSYLLR